MPDMSILPPVLRLEGGRQADQLRPLSGGQVRFAGVAVDAGDGFLGATYWPALVVDCPDGKTRTVVLQCDAEGNGPGFALVAEVSL